MVGERCQWTALGQMEEARRTVGDRPIDTLLISTGGNDIDFSDRLLDLIQDDPALVGAGGPLGDDELNRKQEMREAKKRLQELPGRLDRLARDGGPGTQASISDPISNRAV